MSKARTFLKTEIADAAEMASLHGLRVIMHPTGELELAPARSKRFDTLVDMEPKSAADRALANWKSQNEGETSGRPSR